MTADEKGRDGALRRPRRVDRAVHVRIIKRVARVLDTAARRPYLLIAGLVLSSPLAKRNARVDERFSRDPSKRNR